MLTNIKNILSGFYPENNDSPTEISNQKKLQVATCALFMELAHSDDEFSDEEKKLINSVMQQQFDLDEEEEAELMQLADKKMKNNISLYEYTDVINHNFTKDEKYFLLKNLWRLILIDGVLDQHEEYFIRKITSNLHLEHRDLISAKLEIKKELNLE